MLLWEVSPGFYYWKPPANENRIVVQHSCFIFSARPIDPVIYREISISKEHKTEIRMLLQKYYGIDRGGSISLNSLQAVDKWLSALVMPPPSLALAG